MTEYVRLNDERGSNSSPITLYYYARLTFLTTGLLLLLFVIAKIPNPKRVRHDNHINTYPIWETMKFDHCGSYVDPKECNSAKSCIWCESGAIPSRCYSQDNAKKLPPGVFNCDVKPAAAHLGLSANEMNSHEALSVDNQCGLEKTFSTCNNKESCVWCAGIGIVPDQCYPKDTAQKLSNNLYDCKANVLLEITKDTFQTNEEPICDSTVNQAVGYFRIGNQDKNYFFWFFESRNDPSNDAIVLWMTGGPGCSSELALFAENGPCSVDKSGTSTHLNQYSWNEKANLLYIDQPAGTGFSYGTHDTDEVQVGRDMRMFIREFLSRFPQYQTNDFFVFGESYAGHYVPATAIAVYNYNKVTKDFKVNLQGIGIGNGLTDPEVQYARYADMAYQSGTAPARVSYEQFQEMKEFTPQCINLIKNCNELKNDKACLIAVNACNEKLLKPYASSGYNQYDMRKKCDVPGLCYDFSHVSKFLHRDDVLDYLGVSDEKRDWQSCDMSAHDALMADWMKQYQMWVGSLLEGGVRVLVYAGDVDFIVNYLGCRDWPLALDWSGKEGYNNVKEEKWIVSGKESGMLRSYKNLSFLQVYEAGHMVPMDKPKEALAMLDDFIYNKGL